MTVQHVEQGGKVTTAIQFGLGVINTLTFIFHQWKGMCVCVIHVFMWVGGKFEWVHMRMCRCLCGRPEMDTVDVSLCPSTALCLRFSNKVSEWTWPSWIPPEWLAVSWRAPGVSLWSALVLQGHSTDFSFYVGTRDPHLGLYLGKSHTLSTDTPHNPYISFLNLTLEIFGHD